MFQLKYYLSHSTYNTYDRIMLWAAFTCAFFGFLCSSEFVAPFTQRFESESTLLFHDASIYNNHAQLNIKSSKTDPFRQGCIVRLSPTGNELCPIDALTKFLSRHCKKSGPLFTYSNGTFLTRRRLTTILNHALPPPPIPSLPVAITTPPPWLGEKKFFGLKTSKTVKLACWRDIF